MLHSRMRTIALSIHDQIEMQHLLQRPLPGGIWRRPFPADGADVVLRVLQAVQDAAPDGDITLSVRADDLRVVQDVLARQTQVQLAYPLMLSEFNPILRVLRAITAACPAPGPIASLRDARMRRAA